MRKRDFMQWSWTQINRRIGKRINQALRQISRVFGKSVFSLKRQLSDVYEKYEKDGKLSRDDMVKFDRLNQLFKTVDGVIDNGHHQIKAEIYGAVKFSYEQSHNLTSYAIESEARKHLKGAVASKEVINAAIEAKIDKLTLPQRLEKDRTTLTNRIKDAIEKGIREGSSYGNMAKLIQEATGIGKRKAMNTARTEAHRVQEKGRIDSARSANAQGIIMMKEWNDVGDDRVRHRPKNKADHRFLNGQKIPVEQEFIGKVGRGMSPSNMGAAAEDCNCRCFLTYTVDSIGDPDLNYVEQTLEEFEQRIA